MEGKFGKNLLDPTKVIMEVKVPEERPEWLVALLENTRLKNNHFQNMAMPISLPTTSLEKVSQHAAV